MIKNTTLRDVLTAISLANLLFFPVWARLLGEPARFLRSAQLDGWKSVLALTEVLVVAAIIFLAAQGARRWPKVVAPLARFGFLVAAALALNGIRFVITHTENISFFRAHILISVVLISALLFVMFRFNRPLIRAVQSLVIVFSPFILVTFFKLISLVQGGLVAPWDQTAGAAVSLPRSPAAHRLVWIVFDELDDDEVFESGTLANQMKEFRSLEDETIRFSEAVSSSNETICAVPSMLTGLDVADSKRLGAEELELEISGGEKRKLSAVPSLFSRMASEGRKIAVVGWALPYCRIFGNYVSQCYWEESHAAGNADSLDVSVPVLAWDWILRSVFSPVSSGVVRRLSIDHSPYIRQKHASAYRRLLEKAREVLTDKRFDLVYIHLPVPHLPGIYDPVRDEIIASSRSQNTDPVNPDNYFGNVADYVDNLKLADKTMGIIRADLTTKKLWSDTLLIVSGDHGLRSKTKEHPFTTGPMLVIKLPGGNPSTLYPTPFFMGNIAELVGQALSGKLENSNQVVGWARQQAPPPARRLKQSSPAGQDEITPN